MEQFTRAVEALYNLAVYAANVKDDPSMQSWASMPDDRKSQLMKMMEPLYELSTKTLQPPTEPTPRKTRN